MVSQRFLLCAAALLLLQVVHCADLDAQWERVQGWMKRTVADMEKSSRSLEDAIKAASSSKSCADAVKEAQAIVSDEEALVKKVQAANKDAQEKWDACKSAANLQLCQGEVLKNAGLQEADFGKEDASLIKKAADALKSFKACNV